MDFSEIWGYVVSAIGAGASIALALGIGKELNDSGTGRKWDWKDLLADAAGILIGILIQTV